METAREKALSSLTLAERGFRLPAEWERHAATWIAWPHEQADWPGKFGLIPWVYAEIVRALVRSETVNILVRDSGMQREVKKILKWVGAEMKQVQFFTVPTDRVWTRDSGPLIVVDPSGDRVATHWKFNGWAKYANHGHDQAVGNAIGEAQHLPVHSVEVNGRWIVLEGGAIDVDGEGTLITTEECLLSNTQARNPGFSREQIEAIFTDTLGIKRVVWLEKGIVGDDTHGHVDDVARFVAPGRVLLCQEAFAGDENYHLLAENRERLEMARDAAGRTLEVINLPMPGPICFKGQRLPGSYANFYIGNRVVLVPTFNDPMDRHALGIIAECFPGREVIGIHCMDMVWGLGTIHCATMQEPAAWPR